MTNVMKLTDSTVREAAQGLIRAALAGIDDAMIAEYIRPTVEAHYESHLPTEVGRVRAAIRDANVSLSWSVEDSQFAEWLHQRWMDRKETP